MAATETDASKTMSCFGAAGAVWLTRTTPIGGESPAVPVSPVGAPGAPEVADPDVVPDVGLAGATGVADASPDSRPWPMALTAATLK